MNLNRRAHVMGATFFTSLSLSVTSLAGCASFDPNPAASGTKPVAPAATAGPATPTTGGAATTPTAPTAMTNLSGQAFVGGKPLANATVTVVNAFTGKPVAGLVAAGAGNIVSAGAGNIVSAGAGNYGLAQTTTLTTDANGNYNLNVPEMKNSDMVRIIVKTSGGAELTSLAGGTTNASTYALKQQMTVFRGFNVKINLASTLATNAMGGVLKMLASMSEADRGKAIDNFVDKVAEAEKDFQEKVEKAPPGTEDKLLTNLAESAAKTNVGNSTNSDAAQSAGLLAFKEIAAMLEAVGVDSKSVGFASLVADTLKQVLTVATAGDGLKPTDTLVISSEDFPPSINVDLAKITEGTITYDDPVTGETQTVEIVGTAVGVVDDPVVVDDPFFVDDNTIVEDDPIADVVSNANGKFVPTVSVVYDTTDTDSPLKLTVSQADGEFDVQTIEAKIQRQYVSLINFNAATTLNEPSETLVSGGWATFASTTGHKITKSSATASTFSGVWKDSTGRVIANVTGTDDLTSFVTLKFEFAIAGNDMVDTEGGSVKLEALASIIKLNVTEILKQTASSQPVKITITSRKSADTSNTSDTGGGESAVYYRNISVIQ